MQRILLLILELNEKLREEQALGQEGRFLAAHLQEIQYAQLLATHIEVWHT